MHADLARLAAWDLSAARSLMAHVASLPSIAATAGELYAQGTAAVLFLWLLLWTTWRADRVSGRRVLVRGLTAFGVVALGSFVIALVSPTAAPNTVLGPVAVDLTHAVRVPLGGAWFAMVLAGFSARGPGAWAVGLLGLGLTLGLPAGGYEWPLETVLGVIGAIVVWACLGRARPLRALLAHIADDFSSVLGFAPQPGQEGV